MKYRIMVTLLVILASAQLSTAQQYQIVDLGEISTLFNELWRPLSINDSGQVAGCAPLVAGDFSAFVWENNSYNYLTNGIGSDWANCVNNNYIAVGAIGGGKIKRNRTGALALSIGRVNAHDIWIARKVDLHRVH